MKMSSRRFLRKKRILFTIFSILFFGSVVWGSLLFFKPQLEKPRNIALEKTTPASTMSRETKKPPLNKTLYSLDEPSSLWVIVNKNRPIGNVYSPSNLVAPSVPIEKSLYIRKELSKPVTELFASASQAGHSLMIASAYRSYATQITTYNYYVSQYGETEANRVSAKPGTSEHQTGLAIDISRSDRAHYLEESFGNDPAGTWLREHAHTYGFIVRYPQHKEQITGYAYEPWHLRYVGQELALELYTHNTTMEEYFNVQ